MPVTYDELLSSSVVTRAISRLRGPNTRFQEFFGCLPGGPNVEQVPGHVFTYDIFDKTRQLAKGRAPGAGPATIAPQIIGQASGTIYRSHEKMMLLDERIFRRRPIGGQFGEVDVSGQRYITSQEAHIAQRFSNMREYMLSQMLLNGFGLSRSGDDWIPVAKGGGTFDVDYQIPAGNGGTVVGRNLTMVDLNGTSCGTILGNDLVAYGNYFDTTAAADFDWSDITSPLMSQLYAINRAFQIQHGWPLRHIWVDSVTWQWVIRNTGLINASGTSNMVFRDMVMHNAPDGRPDGNFDVVINCIPQFVWHIYDSVLEVNGTSTALVPANTAIFTAEPDSSWFSMIEGSELVAENVMSSPHEESGIYAWTERKTQPSGAELIAVDNCIPALYVPRCVAVGTVIF